MGVYPLTFIKSNNIVQENPNILFAAFIVQLWKSDLDNGADDNKRGRLDYVRNMEHSQVKLLSYILRT